MKYPVLILFLSAAIASAQTSSGPSKATASEVDTGTNNSKYVTPKALKDSENIPHVAPGTSGNIMRSNGTSWTSSAAAPGEGDALIANPLSQFTGILPTNTEFNYVDGVTSAIQTQLNAKQATLTLGTGVQTALAVNIGSAGAPVLFNGAGGTPSSLTGTNISGTASSLTAGNATLAATVTVIDSTDATSFPAMFDSATGSLALKTDGALLYDASNGTLTATTFAGAGGGLTINAAGFDGNLAATDNTLQEIAQALDDLTAAGGFAASDITGQAAVDAFADGDSFAIYDTSATALKEVTGTQIKTWIDAGDHAFTGAITLGPLASGIVFEGTTADAFETTLDVVDPTADRTVTLPNADTYVPIIPQILTITGPSSARTITIPDANFTAARTDAANTFTGVQTMTSPVISTKIQLPTAAGSSTLTTGGDSAYNTSNKVLGIYNGTKEVGIPTIYRQQWSFDPKAVCDGDVNRLFLMSTDISEPFGIHVIKWKISFEADPTTEVDLDLKRADAFIGVANAAVMDVLDTTAGASSEATSSNINGDAVVATSKVLYLEFGTAYSEANHQIIFEMWYEIEED